MNDWQFFQLKQLIVTMTSMVLVTVLAIIFDGNLVYLAAGALMGLLVPSPTQTAGAPRVETPSDGPAKALGVG